MIVLDPEDVTVEETRSAIGGRAASGSPDRDKISLDDRSDFTVGDGERGEHLLGLAYHGRKLRQWLSVVVTTAAAVLDMLQTTEEETGLEDFGSCDGL